MRESEGQTSGFWTTTKKSENRLFLDRVQTPAVESTVYSIMCYELQSKNPTVSRSYGPIKQERYLCRMSTFRYVTMDLCWCRDP